MSLTINNPSGDTVGKRSFTYFRTFTLPNISLHFSSPPWIKLVLQASHSEPLLQHLAAALGSLHEHLESYSSSTTHSIDRTNNSIEYATQEYSKALIFLSALLTKSDTQSIELVLLGALMCMYYEGLQQDFETAQLHLENCLLVLQPLLRSQSSWLSNNVGNEMQIDNDIIQAFARLDIEASCTLGMRSPSLCISDTPLDISASFTLITQARHLLYGLTSQLHTFMRNTADAYRCDLTPIPLPTIAEANFLQVQLKAWETSFSTYLRSPNTKLTRQEQEAANVLSIQQKVTYMKAATCLYAEEMVFDQFDKEFEEILCLAGYLVYLAEAGEEKKRVVLTFDMGIIEALFWTAIKCRRHSIRHRAIEVLRKVRWQEGVWNAEMMAAVAERFVKIEEDGMSGVEWRGGLSDYANIVPEWCRLHDHGWEMNPKARRTEIRAGRRENGVDGEWTWVKEELTW